MVWFALEEFTAARLPDKSAISRGYLTANGDYMRTALDGHAFEGIVVHVHSLSFSRNSAFVVRVVNDEIGIAA